MKFLKSDEFVQLKAIAALNYVNPFTPERLELEKIILGKEFDGNENVWSLPSGVYRTRANVTEIFRIAENLIHFFTRGLESGKIKLNDKEFRIYQELVFYYLFEKYRPKMLKVLMEHPGETSYPFYRDFHSDYSNLMSRAGENVNPAYSPERVFAVYFQIHRAFYYIFDFIIGNTLAAGRLRAAIWESIFTYDMDRYHRVLFDKMSLITTLISGESGTGKELVARAIAFSQYIPFDPATLRFADSYTDCFQPVQLSAMPKTMLESELFGHKKGAYTGALSDRHGYLEACLPWGSVFLDEIGEIDSETQVKLLRVLQTRSFQRLGDNTGYIFKGKIIAATNKNLYSETVEGTFRSDLYYRLCADTVATIPLRELIHGEIDELAHFVEMITQRILGVGETEEFTLEALRWIEKNLGAGYPWPGNVRELEQCIRNLLIRGSYVPSQKSRNSDDLLSRAFAETNLTADEIMAKYLHAVYEREKNYVKTAEFAGLDRRTVKKFLTEKR